MEHSLSPKDFAAAIGVSESSVKRWADDGSIRVSRTAGGHRRISFSEAFRFIRRSGAGIVRPELLGLPAAGAAAGAGPTGDDFIVQALRGGDLAMARSALAGRYLAGASIGALLDGPMTATLHEVGEAWKQGPKGIHLEHRVTDACLHSLNFLRSVLPAPAADAPVALGCAPAGDPYQVPTLMAAVVLAAEGWREINLGPNLPADALRSAVAEHEPRLVWISFTAPEAAKHAVRQLERVETAVRAAGAELAIGGRSASLAAGPGSAVLESMQALAAFARGLVAARAAARR
jgi:excisionase family DNA binding protein